jgi:hypothetical protein
MSLAWCHGHDGMTLLLFDITMSLDGFVAGPNETLEQPLGCATAFSTAKELCDVKAVDGIRTRPQWFSKLVQMPVAPIGATLRPR